MMRQTTRFLLIIIIVACLFFKRKRETFEQNVPYKQFYEMITYNMKHKMDDPKWVKYVDKLEFKKYAASVGVKTFPNLAVYSQKDSNLFSFDNLPRDYIIKSNKGSGRNIIVRDGKVDREKVLSEINDVCKNNFDNACRAGAKDGSAFKAELKDDSALAKSPDAN